MQQASLCLWASLSAQSSCTAVLWASVLGAATTPAFALLSCSLVAMPLCCPRALGGALYIESIVMYCPHVCSELVSQGQLRILATGTLILFTPTIFQKDLIFILQMPL